MDKIIKLAQKEDRRVMGPLQVAKSSASDEFSFRPTGNFIFQKVEVVTKGTLTLDLNLICNVGGKK